MDARTQVKRLMALSSDPSRDQAISSYSRGADSGDREEIESEGDQVGDCTPPALSSHLAWNNGHEYFQQSIISLMFKIWDACGRFR